MANEIIMFIQQYGALASPVLTITGALLNAFFFRRKTKKAAQIQELEKVKAGMLQEAAEDLLESGKITYSELFKMKNFMQIAKLADEEFKKKGLIEELPEQDFDWHTRYYEACGNVSDEDLQTLWAKILAGEIRKPGSYSLRTLEHLRNLTKEEATLFLKISNKSLKIQYDVLLPSFPSFSEKSGIKFSDILRLEDCGLIKRSSMSYTVSIGDNEGMLCHDEKYVLLAKRISGDKELIIPGYPFTASGKELYSVIGCNLNFSEACNVLSSGISSHEFKVGQVLKIEGDRVTYATIKVEEKGDNP